MNRFVKIGLMIVGILVLVIVVLILLGPAIGGVEGPCTLLPCTGLIRVEVQGDLSEPYQVVVSGGGVEFTVNCVQGENTHSSTLPDERGYGEFCAEYGARFWTGTDFHPKRLTIRVESDGRSQSWTVRPTYTINQPNGPDCGPVCYETSVVVPAP